MSALGQVIPEGFKQTDVGTIPEDWKNEQLFELVKVIDGDRGHNYPSANDFSSDGYCVFLSASNVTKKGFLFKDISFINKTKDEALRKGKLKRNDIVLTTRGTVGQYAFYDETIGYEHLRINSGMVLVRVISKEIKSDYLYSVLKSHIVQKQLSTMSFGSAQPQLTVRDINNFIVCYPSSSKEQAAIANALSDVDALLTELQNLITKKQAIKTASMQQLLTGKTRLPQFANYTEGAVEGKRKGTKPSELGEIPEDWEVKKLGGLGKFKNGINKDVDSFGHGSPFINLMDVFGKPQIKGNENFGLINSTPLEQKEYGVLEGDVLFIRSSVKPSGVGLTAVSKSTLKQVVYSGFLIRFRSNKTLDNEFKVHCFYEENFRKRIVAASTVSANTNINQEALKDIQIAYPSDIEEQNAIATILSDMDNEIQTLEQRLSKTRQIKQGMMQQLLTGRTRLPY